MDVILLEKIRNLGDFGAQVSVKAGYGRNYLIPQGKAVPASAENVKTFEAQRADLEKKMADALSAAQARAAKLAELVVTIAAKSGDEGKLFGSVGTRDIADAVSAAGVELAKSEVRLPEGPLREVGEYEIAAQLHTDVDAVVKVNVVAEA